MEKPAKIFLSIGIITLITLIAIKLKNSSSQKKSSMPPSKKENVTITSMPQLEADKISFKINHIISSANKEHGGLTSYHQKLIDPLIETLYKNGYNFKNGKAIKK